MNCRQPPIPNFHVMVQYLCSFSRGLICFVHSKERTKFKKETLLWGVRALLDYKCLNNSSIYIHLRYCWHSDYFITALTCITTFAVVWSSFLFDLWSPGERGSGGETWDGRRDRWNRHGWGWMLGWFGTKDGQDPGKYIRYYHRL